MTKEDMATYTAAMRKYGSLGRLHAAEMLREVAQQGESGNFTDAVTCEELGFALERICLNSREEDPLSAIVRGYRACERARHSAAENALLGA